MTRSPLVALAIGVVAMAAASSYWSHFIYVAGAYRAMPWAHLAGLPLLAGGAVVVARRGPQEARWPRKFAAWTGAVCAIAATALLWAFLFVGSRLPAWTPPTLTAAPPFALIDQNGDVVRLEKVAARGPVAIVFFRGAFDPWGRAALHDLEARRADIEAVGGAIVGISGDPVDEHHAVAARLGLHFPLGSDGDLAVTTAYGVLMSDTKAPRPGVIVVARGGRVAWTHFGATQRDLANPDDVVAQVRAAAATP